MLPTQKVTTMLPKVIRQLIWSFHDVYDIIGKKERLNQEFHSYFFPDIFEAIDMFRL